MLITVSVVTFVISGCATLDAAQLTQPGACAVFSVIHPSRVDTPETKRQVLAHNQTYRATCPNDGD
jgi:hypothetical protein